MKIKGLFLFSAIITSLVFIGYLGEPGPKIMFGFEINIWVIRLIWFVVAATQISIYMKIRNGESLD